MSISFSDAFAEATGSSRPSERARARGASFGGAIPPLSERGFLDAALWWAEYIGGVFPLEYARPDVGDDRAKKLHPDKGSGGEWDRPSRNLDQIREWWSVGDGGMLSNIGFAPQPSRILIVDVDPRAGGAESWRRLCAENGIDDSECGRVESPRGDGGYHLWWSLAASAEYQHAPLAPGVDRPWQTPIPPSVRYVTVDADAKDPSRRAEFRSYRWTSGDPRVLPVAPDVLLAPSSFVASGSASASGVGGASSGSATGSLAGPGPIGKQTADALAREPIPVGQQSYTFKRIACSMIARGYSDGVIVSTLMQTADISPRNESEPWTPHGMELLVRASRRFIERTRAEEDRRNADFAARLSGRIS